MLSRRDFLATAVIVPTLALKVGAGALNARAAPKSAVYTEMVPGVAVGGFDAVAYVSAGKPVAGSAAISLSHDGAIWRFSSIANRDAFAADPARYAPRYGGYCAYAVAHGGLAEGDPEAWSIVDGRLYLNATLNVRRKWERDTAGHIAKADANWPAVLAH